MTPLVHALAIAAATLVSEDLTAIAVGLLILEGHLNATLGIVACAAGILAGDMGLWLLGRGVGRGVRLLARWPGAARIAARANLDAASHALDRHLGTSILLSRMVPGTRLPLYVAAGLLGRRPWAFLGWTAFSVSLWVPGLILTIVTLGQPAADALRGGFRHAWWLGPSVIVFLLAMRRGTQTWRDAEARARVAARISRLWRWEFWPTWVFYLPVVPWIAWLALRHGGLGTLAAANPGIPDGGFVGESKSAILAALPPRWTLSFVCLDESTAPERGARLDAVMRERGWTWPVILKPDVGERGTNVELVASADAARDYLRRARGPVIAQAYHPGPHEAGIFYVRRPGQAQGRIFSITDKRFQAVVGDGRSSLASLIWRHPRYRMQASRLLADLGSRAGVVPPAGASVPLTFAGNHCRGTMFVDGAHLITPALEARVDAIAQAMPGFFIGRFDVRYRDVDAFMAGEDLAIVELNGVSSESTNIYDPSRSLLWAYRTLHAQWRLIFEIGAENRRRGHAGVTVRRLAALVRAHLMA